MGQGRRAQAPLGRGWKEAEAVLRTVDFPVADRDPDIVHAERVADEIRVLARMLRVSESEIRRWRAEDDIPDWPTAGDDAEQDGQNKEK